MTQITAVDLVQEAVNARDHAHAPYSAFAVGAALVTDTGAVFRGCNVENASFGLTECAERVAVFTAVTAGHRHFSALAVVTTNGAPPCGACLQVLVEFCDLDMPLYLATTESPSTYATSSLKELLPHPFGANELDHDASKRLGTR